MKKWIWIGAIIIVLITGTWLIISVKKARTKVDGVTSASIRIFSPGEKDIQKTREFPQDTTESTWIKISNVVFRKEWTEYGGPRIAMEYDLNEPDVTPETPVYVFIRFRPEKDGSWHLLAPGILEGNGHGIVNHPGHKNS